MPAAYSMDLRERLIWLVREGHSARSAGRLLRVSASTAVKWVQLWRQSGSVAPGYMGGHPGRSPLEAEAVWLNALITAEPDLTLQEIRDRLAEQRSLCVGKSALSVFIRRQGWRFKKKPARGRARPT